MRLDKYLKVSRLIKRRTVAKELIDHDVIFVNGKIAKPSKEIHVNDLITLRLGRKEMEIRVLSLPQVATKKETSDLYEVLSVKVINPSDPT